MLGARFAQYAGWCEFRTYLELNHRARCLSPIEASTSKRRGRTVIEARATRDMALERCGQTGGDVYCHTTTLTEFALISTIISVLGTSLALRKSRGWPNTPPHASPRGFTQPCLASDFHAILLRIVCLLLRLAIPRQRPWSRDSSPNNFHKSRRVRDELLFLEECSCDIACRQEETKAAGHQNEDAFPAKRRLRTFSPHHSHASPFPLATRCPHRRQIWRRR